MRKFLKNELGQAMAVLLVTMSTMIAFAGASIESGHVYFAYRKLQAATKVAALAGAHQIPIRRCRQPNCPTAPCLSLR
jgi:uncharacterized membrane protein